MFGLRNYKIIFNHTRLYRALQVEQKSVPQGLLFFYRVCFSDLYCSQYLMLRLSINICMVVGV